MDPNNPSTEVLMKLLEHAGRVEAKLEHIEQSLDRQHQDNEKLDLRVTKLEASENKRTGILLTLSALISFSVPFIKELIDK